MESNTFFLQYFFTSAPVGMGRAATVDFWQARTPKWRPLHRRTADVAAVFYFSKSSQGPSLGCLASRSGPEYRISLNKVRGQSKSVWLCG